MIQHECKPGVVVRHAETGAEGVIIRGGYRPRVQWYKNCRILRTEATLLRFVAEDEIAYRKLKRGVTEARSDDKGQERQEGERMMAEKRDVFYTYVEDDRVAEQVQERFGQTCVIVATIPDPTDDHPTTDRYRIRFLDGATLEVFPEELLPIPQADTERQAVFTSTIVVDYDDSKETPQEALESYAADNDIVASFEIQKNIGQGQEGNV